MFDYKRRIYYNTINGQVIYDIREAYGLSTPQLPIKDEIKRLSFPIQVKVDCIELEFGQYKEDFAKGVPFRINPRNKKLKFYNMLNYDDFVYNKRELLVGIKFTEDEIYDFYYNQYIDFNLKQLYLANISTCQFKWYSLDDLHIRQRTHENPWHQAHQDRYLADYVEIKTDLAKNILEIGTYWPIFVSKNPSNGLLYVYEGCHRVMSAKLLQWDGLWDNNFKWLCIEFTENYNPIAQNRIGSYTFLPKPIQQRLPFTVKFGPNASPSDKNILEIMDAQNMIFVDKYNIECEVDINYELILMSQAYPHWLRDIIYNFKKETGRIIKPSSIINDQKIWEEWLIKGGY